MLQPNTYYRTTTAYRRILGSERWRGAPGGGKGAGISRRSEAHTPTEVSQLLPHFSEPSRTTLFQTGSWRERHASYTPRPLSLPPASLSSRKRSKGAKCKGHNSRDKTRTSLGSMASEHGTEVQAYLDKHKITKLFEVRMDI